MKEKLYLAKLAAVNGLEGVKERAKRNLLTNKGDFVETLIKILISVVVGALVLGLVYALITNIFPEVETKIQELFEFDGSSAGAGGGTPATP